jgi:O-antigen/teichoic acid export membrane protein
VKLARSFSIYTLSSLLAGAVPLLLLPVLTRYLSETDYGIVATVTTLITFFTPPLFWGSTAAVAVEYHRMPADKFKIFFSSLLRIPLLSFLTLLCLALAGGAFFSERLGVPITWIVVAPVFALLSLFPQLLSTILRMRNQAMTYAYYEIATAITTVTLSLVFVVGLELQWQGRMYALALSSALMACAAIAWLARHGFLVINFDKAYVKQALRFGAGLVPHDLGNQIIRMSDRLILVAMLGLASAGQYAVASQVASVMLVLLSAFNRTWSPYLFSQLPTATPETRIQIVRKSYMVIGGFFIFFLLFNALTPIFYNLLIDRKFHGCMSFVVWITLGYLFTAVYMTYVDYIFYEKKTHILSLITMINMSTHLLLNYLFISKFGTIGSAMAFACTMFLVMLLAFMISSRVHPMPWFFWRTRVA